MDHIIVGGGHSMGYAYDYWAYKYILRDEHIIAHHLPPSQMEADREAQE